MILTRTPLRISLLGGGSDLPSHYEEHEGAVLSFSIDKYIYITAKPNTLGLFNHTHRLVYSEVEEHTSCANIKHPIIRELVKEYAPRGLDLDVMSDIPAGTGMGSSSAFTVGLINTLRGKNAIDDKYGLAESACNIEIGRLGEPIGKQDQYAAAFGGINYLHFTTDKVTVNPIALPAETIRELESSLHLIYIGGVRSASALLKEQQIGDNSSSLRSMADLARTAAQELRDGNIKDLGELILCGWLLKKELSANVSNERIDTIIGKALANGATGAKLLGAGGAGFILLFCPISNRGKMLSALKPMSLKYVPFEIDFEGSKVLYAD